MLAHQIGIVLCRVAAVILLVRAISTIGPLLATAFTPGSDFFFDAVWIGFTGFVPAVAAAGLWFFADRICRFPSAAGSQEGAEPLHNIDFMRVGFALLGTYFVISGLLFAVNLEAANLAMRDVDDMQQLLDRQAAQMTGRRVAYILEIILGLGLILGKERLSELILRARRAGVEKH